MKATVDGEVRCGRALDLRETDVTASAALGAVRDPESWLTCPSPGPAHPHVGLLDGSDVDVERALAAAARSRGYTTPKRDALAEVRDALAEPLPEAPDLAAARERVASASADVTARRERVERLGGKVAALRDAGVERDEVREEHRAAAAALADAETERVAAVEALERARDAARAVRDERERRLRLEDEERRLERATRTALADAIRPSFERAHRAVPACSRRNTLALARVARVRAPLVVAGGPFDRASRAAVCLDAPVVLVRPRV